MQDNMHVSKDAFFNSLKELEHLHAQCASKFELLDNVIRGRENVSFTLIDRCREAVLQLRQSHYVFQSVFAQIGANPLAAENRARLLQLQADTDATAAKAASALSAMLGWVPQAVNTRASAPVARQE